MTLLFEANINLYVFFVKRDKLLWEATSDHSVQGVLNKSTWTLGLFQALEPLEQSPKESGLNVRWRRLWAAVARRAGSKCSMGSKKSANSRASCTSHSYFSVSTSYRPHGFSFVMCRNSPGTTTTSATTGQSTGC